MSNINRIQASINDLNNMVNTQEHMLITGAINRAVNAFESLNIGSIVSGFNLGTVNGNYRAAKKVAEVLNSQLIIELGLKLKKYHDGIKTDISDSSYSLDTVYDFITGMNVNTYNFKVKELKKSAKHAWKRDSYPLMKKAIASALNIGPIVNDGPRGAKS